MNSNSSSWNIPKPCAADWDKMSGDDRRRFCGHCRKHVHNISAMSERERAKFAKPENQRACVVYFQRPDGKIAGLSSLARLRRWFPLLRLAGWSALVTLLPLILTGCMGVRRES